jgi:hypothetical protein
MAAEGSTSSQVANATTEARTQATEVASTAKDEARDVVQQAREQAKTTARQVQSDLRDRANAEATKFAQTLREASSRMQAMAECAGPEQSLPANAVREGAQAAERIASRLDEGGVESIMADFRTWARRNPGGFLLGGAVAGFLVGRAARNFTSNGGTSTNGSNGQGRYESYYEDFSETASTGYGQTTAGRGETGSTGFEGVE